MDVVVVIPVYKNPDDNELVSLRRCCELLKKYEIVLVCPDNFKMGEYQTILNEYNIIIQVERFDDKYFKDIAGYNRLLLSEGFYLRFKKYEYMLIYQLDAYVFRDDLDYWCKKGYDFIGAPILGWYGDKKYYDGISMCVGNGGLSLRKVQTYIDFFNGKKHVYGVSQIAKRIGFWRRPYTRVFVWLLMMFGWRNTPKVVAERSKGNEDIFWSMGLSDTNYALKKPNATEAMFFAFERFPSSLFEITKSLPFGCHAWAKYEYEDFWKDYIK